MSSMDVIRFYEWGVIDFGSGIDIRWDMMVGDIPDRSLQIWVWIFEYASKVKGAKQGVLDGVEWVGYMYIDDELDRHSNGVYLHALWSFWLVGV
jgi:hypothetical protein